MPGRGTTGRSCAARCRSFVLRPVRSPRTPRVGGGIAELPDGEKTARFDGLQHRLAGDGLAGVGQRRSLRQGRAPAPTRDARSASAGLSGSRSTCPRLARSHRPATGGCRVDGTDDTSSARPGRESATERRRRPSPIHPGLPAEDDRTRAIGRSSALPRPGRDDPPVRVRRSSPHPVRQESTRARLGPGRAGSRGLGRGRGARDTGGVGR